MDKVIIKDIIEKFFFLLWVNFELKTIDVKNNIIDIKIKSDDSNLIIWYSWNNLTSIRSILNIILYKKFNEKIILNIEINDYLYSKDQKLYSFIDSKIKKNKDSNKIILSNFNSYERKKIHSYIKEKYSQSWYFTTSIWELNNRKIYILKKSKTLTIDIDSIDI